MTDMNGSFWLIIGCVVHNLHRTTILQMIFDLLTLILVRNVARVKGHSPADFVDTTTIRFRFMGHWTTRLRLITWPSDLDLGGLGACGWCGRRPPSVYPCTKFEVRRPCYSEVWCKMCVRINGSGDFDLWRFDLETGTRVAFEVRNLASKFAHGRPLGSRIIRYVRDGRTNRQMDRRTDKSNAYCALPTCGRIITIALLSRASIAVIGILSVPLPRPGDESKPLNVYHRTFFSILCVAP